MLWLSSCRLALWTCVVWGLKGDERNDVWLC